MSSLPGVDVKLTRPPRNGRDELHRERPSPRRDPPWSCSVSGKPGARRPAESTSGSDRELHRPGFSSTVKRTSPPESWPRARSASCWSARAGRAKVGVDDLRGRAVGKPQDFPSAADAWQPRLNWSTIWWTECLSLDVQLRDFRAGQARWNWTSRAMETAISRAAGSHVLSPSFSARSRAPFRK